MSVLKERDRYVRIGGMERIDYETFALAYSRDLYMKEFGL
jgi:hypothetical protein